VDATGLASQVGELAGVFFHVRPLDLHPPGGAVFQWRIEVAVDGDRLVVLRNLVILGHVRVEVVLPGEAAPRHDLAVQRQPDPNR
jgi:hypothetical protein